MKQNVVLGIDIGGTNTVYGFVNETGESFGKGSIPTLRQNPAEDLFKRLFQEIQNNMIDANIIGIGIGGPNANFYSKKIENPVNLDWGIVDCEALVRKYMDLPVYVTNDANAAALGEMEFGIAKQMKNFILITLGTGLGSGIVVNGELVYGHDGFAGELGHVRVEKEGRICGCGRKGCLETYASAGGMVRNAFELMTINYDTECLLRSVPMDHMTSKMIYEAAVKGDEIALETFEVTAKYIGEAMADIVTGFSPEAIIFFGGPLAAGDMLLKPIKKYMEERMLRCFKDKVKILKSGLPLGDAAVLGAAALVWHQRHAG